MITLSTRFRTFSSKLPVFVLALVMSAAAVAEAQNPVVMVEEDWELQLDVPDQNSAGPQVACVLSPCGNLDGIYVTLELNHCSAPDFSPGGVQLQVWDGEQHLETRYYPNSATLATADERISWTQRVGLRDAHLVFEVRDGSSSTWGAFGNEGNLKVAIGSDLAQLDGYDPQASREHSGVTFASHCVKKLTLKAVRLTRADETVESVALNYVIHEK